MRVRRVPPTRGTDRNAGPWRAAGAAGLAVLIAGAAMASALGGGRGARGAEAKAVACTACHTGPEQDPAPAQVPAAGRDPVAGRDPAAGRDPVPGQGPAAGQDPVPQAARSAGNGPPVDPDRPFRHAVHRDLSCQECHATGRRHRSPREWTARDCAACHHGTGSTVGCADCHEPAAFAAPRRTDVPLSLSVWEETRVRELPFEHETHEPVACQDCHRSTVTRAPRECSECHANHHRPEAECSRCHVAPEPGVHGLGVHLDCAGSGCHADVSIEGSLRSRTFCLVCHESQRDHRPGETCAQCHAVPDTSSVGAAADDGVSAAVDPRAERERPRAFTSIRGRR